MAPVVEDFQLDHCGESLKIRFMVLLEFHEVREVSEEVVPSELVEVESTLLLVFIHVLKLKRLVFVLLDPFLEL